MPYWLPVGGLAAFLFALPIARAESVYFDFRGPTIPPAATWTAAGITLQAAPLYDGSAAAGFPLLSNDSDKGLGVIHSTGEDPLINAGESIQFTFTPTVQVTAISFSMLDAGVGNGANGDDISFAYFDGVASYTLTPLGSVTGIGTYRTYTYLLPTSITAATFTLGSADTKDQQFGITDMSVDFAPPPVGAVAAPLPSGFWGGVLLLAGLGFVRLRRRHILSSSRRW